MKIHHASIKKAAKFHITLSVEDNEVVATAKDGTRLASGLQGNKVLEDAITKQTGKPAKGNGKLTVKAIVERQAALQAKNAKKARKPKVEDDEELEDLGDMGDVNEDDSDADQSRSVVKAKYKALYKPHKDKCGDDVSMLVNKHVSREDPETGEMRVNKKALEKFAKANGCWNPMYAGFVSRTGGWNSGMAVMGVTNRLRGKIRQAAKAELEFKIQWV